MRLDTFLAEREGISRTRAQNLIKTGGVTVGGIAVDKPSFEVGEGAKIAVTDTLKYASLGGLKLENAIQTFSVSIKDKKCIDVGAANGGFTDCLLRMGAREVCAVDLTIAFPEQLSHDPRVRVFDGVNVKDLPEVFSNEHFDFLCVDLSFISLCPLFPLLSSLITETGVMIALFKPQFEVGKAALPKSGVVKDRKVLQKAFDRFLLQAELAGLKMLGECDVPAVFPDKNRERTVLFKKIQ